MGTIGGAFLEHLVYDENGQLLTGNLADYLIPAATDFSEDPGDCTGELPVTKEPARRQRRRRGRDHPEAGAHDHVPTTALPRELGTGAVYPV
jgi:hypothetical protein